jgi:3',5'-nucleoside bisphosphate phosphatase
MTSEGPRPLIDLHSHSTRSDGTFEPARLVAEAARRGVTVLALTDHDTVAGLDEAEAAAREHGLSFVPGVEFTCGVAGMEVHLLGLGVNRANPTLLRLCDEIQYSRRERFMEMAAKLRQAGLPVSVSNLPHSTSLARPYMARLLVEQGYVQGYQDAFDRYLKRGAPAFVPHREVPIGRAIEAAHAAGGVALLAHPGLYRDGEAAVRAAVADGLDGIEVIHSDHNHQQAERYRALADELGLLVSGGADFHGPEHARAHFFGKRGCPPADYERLKVALENRARG